MTSRHLLTPIRSRLPRHDDERGSIPFLLLVIVLASALGAVMLSNIVNQTRVTRYDQTRVRTLDAAQAGVDFVLGQIRSAVNTTTGAGDTRKLPCPTNGWTNYSAANATLDATATLTFSATVAYYKVNPSGMTATQLAANVMLCSTTAGTFGTPKFALITSKGLDSSQANNPSVSKARTVQTTYNLQTNDINVSGGQIRVYPSGSAQYCMDAGTTPTVGTPVQLQLCSTTTPPSTSQIWAYRSDLSIELVSTSGTPVPLCLDTADPTTHSAGLAIVLKKCGALDPNPSNPTQTSVCPAGSTPTSYSQAHSGQTCAVSPYDQQWSVDDNAHLRGATSDQTNTDGYCIDAASQAAGTALLLQSCAGGTTDTRETWVPSPTTGAGMAGAGNNQLVNYAQFATCIDITGQDPNAAFEIAYTCKQNPDPTKVAFNQKIIPSPALQRMPTLTLLTVKYGSTTYCLQSPQTPGGYPRLSTPCPSSVTSGSPFAWTVNQRYAANDTTNNTELSYADKYTIKDTSTAGTTTNGATGAPLCLGLGANNDLLSNAYYKIVVTNCDGSTAQKWNADASSLKASLTNTHEMVTSGS